MGNVDAQRSQLFGIPDARHLERLGGIDGATAENDLACPYALGRAFTAGVLDADGTSSLEQDPQYKRAGPHFEVGTSHHRVQVRARRADAPPAVDVAVEGSKALLAIPVHVARQLVTC